MNIQKILINFFSILRSIWMVGIFSFRKRETRKYPEKPIQLHERYKGKIVLTKNSNGKERCVACNLCATICPVGCISLQKSEDSKKKWYPEFFRINFSRCIFCGLCEEACPTFAIQLTPEFELPKSRRKNLVYEKNDLLISSTGKNSKYDFYKVKEQKCRNAHQDIDSSEGIRIVDRKSILP